MTGMNILKSNAINIQLIKLKELLLTVIIRVTVFSGKIGYLKGLFRRSKKQFRHVCQNNKLYRMEDSSNALLRWFPCSRAFAYAKINSQQNILFEQFFSGTEPYTFKESSPWRKATEQLGKIHLKHWDIGICENDTTFYLKTYPNSSYISRLRDDTIEAKNVKQLF